MSKVEEFIARYREKDLPGKIVDLLPVKEEDLSSIVRMRNDPKMMYYLNQSQEITLESQNHGTENIRSVPMICIGR